MAQREKYSLLINLAAFVVVVAGISQAKAILIPFLLASFLAIICGPPLYWLRTKGVPRFVSIILLVLAVIAIEMLLAGLISSSIAEFSRALPLYQERLNAMIKSVVAWAAGHGMDITEKVVMEQFDPGRLMRIVASMLNNLLAVLTNTFMIMLTLVFILLEATGFPDKLRAMSGNGEPLREYGKIVRGVNRYLGIKVLTSMATGVIIGGGLLLLGVDFALMWGVVAFLLNFIPTIGSIIAAVPPMLLALVQLGPGVMLATALLYLVTNISIGSILEPKVMGAGIGLSALVIFLSLAFWGWVLGPVGMLLSVPLTMTLKIALAANEKTRHIALLLGSNAEAAAAMKQIDNPYSNEERA